MLRLGKVRFICPTNSVNSGCAGFLNARTWLADVREHADPNVTCILVGNKVDLVEELNDDGGGSQMTPVLTSSAAPGKHRRQVTTEEATAWARAEGLLFVEASAKSGRNVEDAFVQAACDILAKIRQGVFDNNRVSTPLVLLKPGSHLVSVSLHKMMVAETTLVSWRQTIQGIEYEPYIRARRYRRTDVLLLVGLHGTIPYGTGPVTHVLFRFPTIFSYGCICVTLSLAYIDRFVRRLHLRSSRS